MSDNGAHKESVVCDLLTFGDLGLAQVQVHLVVGGGDVVQVKVAQPVNLQLERQPRLQVSVDLVLTKLDNKEIQNRQNSSKICGDDTFEESKT
jgi:hypothetical protein